MVINGYIGTYTQHSGNGGARGIYFFSLNTADGRMEHFRLAADIPNPSYLAPAASGKYLYAVNELHEFEGFPGGTVTAFAVDQTSFEIKPLNRQRSGGKGPCHIALSQYCAQNHVQNCTHNVPQHFAVVSNYSEGAISVFPLCEDGALSEISQVIRFEGSGPVRNRQNCSHAHSFTFAPDGSYGLACDLGADRIMPYTAENNALVPMPYFCSAPGSGPRHLVFSPDGKLVYCVNELNSTVDVLSCCKGVLQRKQTVSTLPEGCVQVNTTAAIKLSADARFLYVSNRGHDSIAVFAVDKAGLLQLEAVIPTGGKNPRDFAIDSSGQFLLVCNQDSDTLVVFEIDPVHGTLFRKWEYPVPSGVCVVLM
ncbi:MAG: lactonase family protein [Treponema sp.]|nr:lactonase family protein [Treponema sp.]